MQTNFLGDAQMSLHEAYEQDGNKVLAAYTHPDASANSVNPTDILKVISRRRNFTSEKNAEFHNQQNRELFA